MYAVHSRDNAAALKPPLPHSPRPPRIPRGLATKSSSASPPPLIGSPRWSAPSIAAPPLTPRRLHTRSSALALVDGADAARLADAARHARTATGANPLVDEPANVARRKLSFADVARLRDLLTAELEAASEAHGRGGAQRPQHRCHASTATKLRGGRADAAPRMAAAALAWPSGVRTAFVVELIEMAAAGAAASPVATPRRAPRPSPSPDRSRLASSCAPRDAALPPLGTATARSTPLAPQNAADEATKTRGAALVPPADAPAASALPPPPPPPPKPPPPAIVAPPAPAPMSPATPLSPAGE